MADIISPDDAPDAPKVISPDDIPRPPRRRTPVSRPDRNLFGETFEEGATAFREGLTDLFTLESMDEIGGFIVSQITGEPYRTVRNRIRREQEQTRQKAPGAYLAGGGLAALGTGAAAPMAARAAGLQNIRPLAATTTYGAATGAGMAPELGDVPLYAAGGALTGAALPPLVEGATRLAMAPGAAARATAEAGRRALTTSDQAIVDAELSRIIRQSGKTADEILEDFDRYGPETVLADVLGDAGPTELRRAMTDSGTREAVMKRLGDRQFLERNVVRAEAREALGIEGDIRQTVGQIRKQRKDTARLLYDEAYEQDVVMTPQLREFLERPTVRKAYRQVRKDAKDAGRELPQIFVRSPQGKWTLKTEEIPDFETLDAIKRELDERVRQIGKGLKTGKGSARYQAAKTLRDNYRQYLRDTNKAYERALFEYESDSAVLEAVEMGRKVLDDKNVYLEDVMDMTEGMSPSVLQSFRMGVAQSVQNRMRNLGESRGAANFLDNENIQEKIAFLMKSPEDAQRFANRMRGVQRRRVTKTVAEGGPKTAADIEASRQRMMRAEAVAELTQRAGRPQSAFRAFADVVQMFFRRRDMGVSPEVQAKIAEALMSDNRTALVKAVQTAAPSRLKGRQRRRWAMPIVNALKTAAANPSIVQQAMGLVREE